MRSVVRWKERNDIRVTRGFIRMTHKSHAPKEKPGCLRIQFLMLPKTERQRKPYSTKLLAFVLAAAVANSILALVSLFIPGVDKVISGFGAVCFLLVAALVLVVQSRQDAQLRAGVYADIAGSSQLQISVGDLVLWIAAAAGIVGLVAQVTRLL